PSYQPAEESLALDDVFSSFRSCPWERVLDLGLQLRRYPLLEIAIELLDRRSYLAGRVFRGPDYLSGRIVLHTAKSRLELWFRHEGEFTHRLELLFRGSVLEQFGYKGHLSVFRKGMAFSSSASSFQDLSVPSPFTAPGGHLLERALVDVPICLQVFQLPLGHVADFIANIVETLQANEGAKSTKEAGY
ncbi:hypothetical protein HYW68_02610, partial [Candidatus Parcubacteria bacterium]|nr:hypothetical protein [Candidatus Parcubacteria bacterium]